MSVSDEQAAGAKRLRNRQPREARREQLILATIEAIAVKGYSATTIADVADRAKLSRGIVNFHFDSKDKLFHATLQYMTDEYANAWQKALSEAGHRPAARLRALVDADFDAHVCAPRRIAAWFAFMAEARSSVIYRKLCGHRDSQLLDAIRDQCRAMKQDAGYPYDEGATALALYALLEGLWMRLMLDAPRFRREEAHRAALAGLALMFPMHFASDGAALP